MYRSLVICCSQRFKAELDAFVPFLEKRKKLVFYPNFRHHRKDFIRKPEHKRLEVASYKAKVPGLSQEHFDKLDQIKTLGGICLIFNPRPLNGQKKKFGYIGSNTQGEVGYCRGIKLPVIMLKPNEEEWIMTVACHSDRRRIFTTEHPKKDPMDFDAVYTWLKRWLQ